MARTALADSPFRLSATPSEADLLAKYFRALGDPTRVTILRYLADEGELSVGEIVDRLEIAQPRVSNHLACLRWCGFVETRRDQRTIYNRIADARVENLLALAEALLAGNEEHVAACRATTSGK